jgi:hypothetical protein
MGGSKVQWTHLVGMSTWHDQLGKLPISFFWQLKSTYKPLENLVYHALPHWSTSSGNDLCLGQNTVLNNQSPPILQPWVFLFWSWQQHLWRLRNAGTHLFRVYWRDWHELITLKLSIYHFEPPKFGHPPKQFAKNAEKCAINSFFKAEDDPTKIGQFPRAVRQLNDLQSHIFTPKYRVFVNTFASRKFWQCRNSTFRTIQRYLHKLIRLKLYIYIFWSSKIWPTPKQLAKNTEKCPIDSFFRAEDDPQAPTHLLSQNRKMTANVISCCADWACPLYRHVILNLNFSYFATAAGKNLCGGMCVFGCGMQIVATTQCERRNCQCLTTLRWYQTHAIMSAPRVAITWHCLTQPPPPVSPHATPTTNSMIRLRHLQG